MEHGLYVFGNNIFKIDDDNNIIHNVTWKIRVNQGDSMYIGICGEPCDYNNDDWKSYNDYLYVCNSGEKYHALTRDNYALPIKGPGSIITVSLNTYSKTLSFKIDNVGYIAAFCNLPNNNYRFVADLLTKDDEITILSETVETVKKCT